MSAAPSMIHPRLTVLLPTWNARTWLPDAVASVRAQTWRDFELLILDDGSSDGTAGWVRAIRDPRVRLERSEANLGVARTLNRGLALARGDFVARMDADDLCRPERFARQLAAFERRPDLVVCGAWVRVSGAGRPFTFRYPTGAACVRASMLFANPLAHAAVMFRRAAFARHALRYDETVAAAQDFELWRRCAGLFEMDNLPAVLLDYRVHAGGVTVARREVSRRQLLATLAAELQRLGQDPDPDGLIFHAEVGNGSGMRSAGELAAAAAWLDRLIEANGRCGAYPAEGLARAAGRVWFMICRNSAFLGPVAWRAYRVSPLGRRRDANQPSAAVLLAAILFARLKPASQRGPQGRLGLAPGSCGEEGS